MLTVFATAFQRPLRAQPAEILFSSLGRPIQGADPGDVLLSEFNCVACHQADAGVRQHLASKQAPRLGASGLRITPQYLRAYLTNPHGEGPGRTMPDLLQGMAPAEKSETVEALVHFLVSQMAANDTAAVGADQFKIKQGRLLFHRVGCAACHAPQEAVAALAMQEAPLDTQTPSSLSEGLFDYRPLSISLANLARKTTVGDLAKFLVDPLKVRPSGRMPSLNLTESEATAIAMYLLRDQAPGVANPSSPGEKIKGLRYEYFEEAFNEGAPDFTSFTPKATGVVDGFTLAPLKRKDRAGLRFTGLLTVLGEGVFTFYTASDDGSRLYIGDQLVVQNDGLHALDEKKGNIRLKAGDHPITVTWFNGDAEFGLKVSWKGPGINKQEIPAAVLAHFGQPMRPLGAEKFTADSAKATRGRRLFASLGCAACHEISAIAQAESAPSPHPGPLPRERVKQSTALEKTGSDGVVESGRKALPLLGGEGRGEGEPSSSLNKPGPTGETVASTLRAKSWGALNPTQPDGCLGENVRNGLPQYFLTRAEREALRATLGAREKLAQPLSPKEQVTRTMVVMNCFACHTRDGLGGSAIGRLDYFSIVGEADLGEEGRIPPQLTRVGDKLRPEWIREVLLNKGAARPYMATRMPQFGEANVGHLAAAFEQADGPGKPEMQPEYSARDAKQGRKLVGTGGMACISCHVFAGRKSLGIPALDMATMTRRLKQDWFHRYLIEPASLRPGTRMPTFWPEGKSTRPEILEGNTDRQIDAIWTYLSKGAEADLPPGLVQGKLEIIADKEPVIYRNFIAGAGSRAIGVGYPEKINLAFDANELRLALIWQGAFIDAARHRTGRGEGYEPPLGDSVVKLPPGAPFAILADTNTSWPSAVGKKADYQMHGYGLDDRRRPAFLYTFRDIEIEDFPSIVAGELDPILRRALVLHAAQPAKDLWFRAALASKIEALPDGTYVIADKLKLRLRVTEEAKPIVRQIEGHSELLVPVIFIGQEAHILEEMIW